MRKKKRIVNNLEITDVEFRGKGVGRDEGKVIFVEDALPGENLDVRITRSKKEYSFASPIKYHKKSPDRIIPFCSHFDYCGGCTWQNISYAKQLEFKEYFVKEAFDRIGKLEYPGIQPVIPCDKTEYYRNKLEFTFSDSRWLLPEEVLSKREITDKAGLGFHVPGYYDKVIDIEHCYLQEDPSNQIRRAVKEFAVKNDIPFFNVRKKEGLLRNLFIRNTTTGEWLVMISFFYDDRESINKLMSFLKESFSEITSLHYVINPKQNDDIRDLEMRHFSGKPFIEETLGDLKFKIGPKSFFQTNSFQAMKLYDVVKDFASLSGNEIVYDLYTGIGSIALYLASQSKKVIGVELIPEAIDDANENARFNRVDNCAFLTGDVKDVLNGDFYTKHGKADLIIIDPPRAGLHPKTVQALLESEVQRIIYVSCNPATQARDLSLLCEKYSIEKVQPVDMFPQTYHIENVVLLSKVASLH